MVLLIGNDNGKHGAIGFNKVVPILELHPTSVAIGVVMGILGTWYLQLFKQPAEEQDVPPVWQNWGWQNQGWQIGKLGSTNTVRAMMTTNRMI